MKKIVIASVLAFVCLSSAVAQLLGRNGLRPTSPMPVPTTSAASSDGVSSLNFNAAPVDMVFEVYSKLVNKTVLKDPGSPSPTITLQSRPGQKLSDAEQIEAIETILEMNGIHLEPYGEKFVRALPRAKVRKDGIPLLTNHEEKLDETIKVVSMMIPFKNIGTDEAQKALEGFKSDSGILLVFERTNSILVTDTQQNINRMLEIAKMIDVATPVLENVFVRQIKNASAAEVKTALEAIVQESQKEQEKSGKVASSAAPVAPRPLFTPGSRFLRPGQRTPQPTVEPNASLVMSVSDADRGMIRGKVLILADERSNKLIIVTQKTNMDFFDKVIEQLDVETTPDVQVKVYRLKYAEAEDVSDMINDLIGNAASSKSSSKQNQNLNAKSGSGSNLTRATATANQRKSANQRSGESKAGELSKDNVTVLADKRINGLVVMARTEDIPTIEQIIESMDIKLSQVLIETVIIEVQLGDDISTGIDWVRGIQAKGDQYRQAIGGGGGKNIVAAAGEAMTNAVINGISKMLPAIFTPGGVGLTYGIYSDRLDLGAVIQASKNDSRSKYVASPVIMTVDNQDATIDATQKWRFLTGYQVSSSVYASGNSTAPQYTSQDLGIKIKVTPKINPNGTVMLKVSEEYNQLGAKQSILDPQSQSRQIDTLLTRKMEADVLLENNQTVVLGGLTETKVSESVGGIPILKDIPWIGKYLFGSTSSSETRNELLVFMTPYVLSDAESAQVEAMRRKATMSDPRPWDDHGWSKSGLADPMPQKEQLRRLKDEWKKQDEERKARLAIEQAKAERAEALEKMNEKERAAWLEMHREELEREAETEQKKNLLDAESQEGLKKLAEDIRMRQSGATENASEKPEHEK